MKAAIKQAFQGLVSPKKKEKSSGVEKKSNKRTGSSHFKRPEVQNIGSRDVNRTQPERGRTDRKNADIKVPVHADVSSKLVTVFFSLEHGSFDLASAELDDIASMLADVVKRHFEGSGKTFKQEDVPMHVKRLFKKEHLHEALKNLGQKALEALQEKLGKLPKERQDLGHGLMSELTEEVKREFLFRAKSHAIAAVQKYEAANQTLSDPEMAYLKGQVKFLVDNPPKEGKGPTKEHLKGLLDKIQQAEDKAERTSTGSWSSFKLEVSEGNTDLPTQRAVSRSESRSEDEGARSESEESEVQTQTQTQTLSQQADPSIHVLSTLIAAMSEEDEIGTESEPKAQNGKANRLTAESEAIGDSEETSSASGSESASASDSDMDAAALARVTDADLSNADVTGLRRLFNNVLQVLPTQTTLQGVLVLKNLADKLERTADRHTNSSAASAKAKKLASDVQGVVAKIDALVIDALLQTKRSAIGGLIFDDLDGLRDLKALKDAVELYQSHPSLDAIELHQSHAETLGEISARQYLKNLSSDIKQVELGITAKVVGPTTILFTNHSNVTKLRGVGRPLRDFDATQWPNDRLMDFQERVAELATVYVPDPLKRIQVIVQAEIDRRKKTH